MMERGRKIQIRDDGSLREGQSGFNVADKLKFNQEATRIYRETGIVCFGKPADMKKKLIASGPSYATQMWSAMEEICAGGIMALSHAFFSTLTHFCMSKPLTELINGAYALITVFVCSKVAGNAITTATTKVFATVSDFKAESFTPEYKWNPLDLTLDQCS